MIDRPKRNLPASVHDRLLALARNGEQPFNELLLNYAMERFLYRLGEAPHADRFALKGGLMLLVWRLPASRHTMDIDLLGRSGSTVDQVTDAIRDACQRDVEDDGLVFDAPSLTVSTIHPERDRPGVRAKFLARLGTARVTLQIDVGFGDVVVPAEVWADYPTILDFPAPRIKTYTRESLIAEKLEAMVKLGEINSRMNDFYDVWLLPTVSTFTGALLSEAVRRTFENRRTGLPSAPRFIADTFAESPRQQTQWKAFLSRQRREDVPARFSDVTDAIVAFAGPIFAALARGEALEGEWLPGGPWSGGSA